MNTHISARSASTPLIENTETEALPMEKLPPEIQEHICSFISGHERTDLNGLSCVSKDFNARMEEHREMARIISETGIDIHNNPELVSEQFADLLPKLDKFAPPLRARFFNFLAKLANHIGSSEDRQTQHHVLFAKIRELPAEDRAETVFRLAVHNNYLSFPSLVDLFDAIPDTDKPEIIGLLAMELHDCRDREFPRVTDALFRKIDALPVRQKYEALSVTRKYLFENRGGEGSNPELYNSFRQHQFFPLAYEFIAKLPMPERIMAIGEWTSPMTMDDKFNDAMSLILLSAIPADVDPNPMVINVVVKQMTSNFDSGSDLSSLARFRTILKGISHLSPACRATVLQCWSQGDNCVTQSYDLQWQAMFEECCALPDPHKGHVLISLASGMARIPDAFHWSGKPDDSRNIGKSASEKAANTRKRRNDTVFAYLEDGQSSAELAEYYQAASFTCMEALPALLKLSREVPGDQREKIFEQLCIKQDFVMINMNEDECALYGKLLSGDILTLPDKSAQERLFNLLKNSIFHPLKPDN
jgi:hypothetical protein